MLGNGYLMATITKCKQVTLLSYLSLFTQHDWIRKTCSDI